LEKLEFADIADIALILKLILDAIRFASGLN